MTTVAHASENATRESGLARTELSREVDNEPRFEAGAEHRAERERVLGAG